MTQSKPAVLIIGGGVIGVTTGILLQLLGYQTRIICRHWLGDMYTKAHASEPRFASYYPAASIIPHSVQIADESSHLPVNIRIFKALAAARLPGVRMQRHFEVFEQEVAVEPYASHYPNFRQFSPTNADQTGNPRRSKELPLFGWSFKTPFVEMPIYRHFLSGLYQKLGGAVERGRFELSQLHRQKVAEVLVNCAGAWGPELSGDSQPARFLKGLLVHLNTRGSLPKNSKTEEVFSYSYRADVTCPDQYPWDVYFYPRADGWLIGGTRLQSDPVATENRGLWDDPGHWSGETWDGPFVTLPQKNNRAQGVEVPLPIIELNREILFASTGVDIAGLPKTALLGYRYMRHKVRLEVDQETSSRPVFHNYGHGGAGVTLSWSSALKVANLIEETPSICAEELEEKLLACV